MKSVFPLTVVCILRRDKRKKQDIVLLSLIMIIIKTKIENSINTNELYAEVFERIVWLADFNGISTCLRLFYA